MSPVAAIKEQMQALSMKEREELRDWLDTQDVPPGLVAGTREEFEEMLHRRTHELDSGAVKGVPWEEVDRKIKEKFGLRD